MKTTTKNIAVCVLFALFFAAGFMMFVFMPHDEYSESERRKLASMPEFSVDSVMSGRFMKDFESYTTDAVPFRDKFRMLKALCAVNVFQRRDNNGVYTVGDYASALEYPINEASVDKAVSRFRHIYEKYLKENKNVYISVIPDKNCFLASKEGYPSMDYELFEKLVAQKADFAEYIKISDLLEIDDYYMTDTHWRQEKIVDIAQRLAENMDTSLQWEYKENTLDREFSGVYYGQSALPLKKDKMSYLTCDEMDKCLVFDLQNDKIIDVYNMELAAGRDMYEMYLSGSLSLITIDNPNSYNDRELVLFRDSFGSSIAPLLISGYSKITLVDIRYIHPDILEQFIDFDNSDILFLYSTLVLNNSATIK